MAMDTMLLTRWTEAGTTGFMAQMQQAGGMLSAAIDPLVYNPVFWIGVTLAGYGIGEWAHRRTNASPLVNPVLIALACVWLMLQATGLNAQAYGEAAALMSLLLAPIVVALAIPAARQLTVARECWLAVLAGVASGGLVAILVTWTVASWLGASPATLVSLAPRSTTVAVAIEWSQLMGGIAAVTAFVTTVSAVLGAMFGVGLLSRIGVRDERAVGLALGVSAHGLGAARALAISETACAFASIGLAANAIFTSIVLAASTGTIMSAPMLGGTLHN